MLAVSFFLLWHVLYMTEAGWTFDAMEGFPAACAALAGISLLLCRFRWGSAWLGAGRLAWMAAACLIRDAHLLQLQWEPISRGMLAFLVPYFLLLTNATPPCGVVVIAAVLSSAEELIIHLVTGEYDPSHKSVFMLRKKTA